MHPESEQRAWPTFFGEDDEFLAEESFDLGSFFDQDVVTNDAGTSTESPSADLLLTLRDEADQVIHTFSTNITAEAFNKTSAFVSGAASLFGSIIGACGPVCLHGVSSLAQAGQGLSAAGVGGLSGSGLSIDSRNVHIDENIDSLARATGFSRSDLLSGRISAQDILAAFFSAFSEGSAAIFGFGLIESLMGTLFNSVMPTAEA